MKIGGGAAADGPALMVAWVGSHTLASATGRDGIVRMYDLDTEDNYFLRIGKMLLRHTWPIYMQVTPAPVEHASHDGVLLHFCSHVKIW